MKYQGVNCVAVVSLVATLAGCSQKSVTFKMQPPRVPDPPVVLFNTLQDAEAVVITDVTGEPTWDADRVKKAKSKPLAVLPVSGPETSGDLVSAVLTMGLRSEGVKLVDRQVTQAILNEVKMLEGDQTNASDGQKFSKLKKLTGADYLVTVAVTTLESHQVNVKLPPRKFELNDLPRYTKDYSEWKRDSLEYLSKMDEAARIFDRNPPFDKGDQYEAWLLRNSIAKVRRDVERTDFIGVQTTGERTWAPFFLHPDFFNRDERTRSSSPVEVKEQDYSQVSEYGPYSEYLDFGYRPLLYYASEKLPKSPRKISFEWQEGAKAEFEVTQANASIAFRVIEAESGEYVGLGVLETHHTSRPAALQKLAKNLVEKLASKLK